MIYSMTGYGKGSAASNNISAEVEIKSVNSRFLEIFLRLSPSLMSREIELKELVKKKIKRGKLNLTIQLKSNELSADLPEIDEEKLNHFLKQIEKIKKAADLKEQIKLEHLLNVKDIFSAGEEEFSDEEFNLIKEALNNALDNLLEMRSAEGEELAKDLTKRVDIITEKVDLIESETSDSVSEYFLKLKEKLKLLLEDTSINPERLDIELALLAEKAEITEECVRLRSHLKFFLETINKGNEPGRKLNFLCQEMNREANTISSKSLSTGITHNAVAIKEEIEKIREQVQNIE